jgi:integrase/recombinase XerD
MANIAKSVAITREEVELLYYSLPFKTIKEKQFKVMVVLLFETGIRISELLNLKIGSIKKNFGKYVLEFNQKGDRLHRVELNELCLSFLGCYLELMSSRCDSLAEDHNLFQTSKGRSINRKNFYRSLKAIKQKIGFGFDIHPHTARVSFIRQRHEEGMDVYSIKKMVGHSSVNTTERYLNH